MVDKGKKERIQVLLLEVAGEGSALLDAGIHLGDGVLEDLADLSHLGRGGLAGADDVEEHVDEVEALSVGGRLVHDERDDERELLEDGLGRLGDLSLDSVGVANGGGDVLGTRDDG